MREDCQGPQGTPQPGAGPAERVGREANMRLAVTGPNGFLGSEVVRAALAAGHQVWAPVRPGADGSRLRGIAGRFVVSGVEDRFDLEDLLREARADVVIHTAWPVPPGAYLEGEQNEAGRAWSEAVFGAAARVGVEHVVAVGSCLELGDSQGIRAEEDPPAPTTGYARAKDAARRLGDQILGRAGVRFTWARMFHLFGPGESPGRLTRDALDHFRTGRPFTATHGDDLRDWTFSADAAEALVLLAERGPGGVAHVCGGGVRTTGDHLRTLARLCGTADLLTVREATSERPSILGLPTTLSELGWAPRRTHLEALRATVEVYRGAEAAPPRPIPAARRKLLEQQAA